MAQAPRTLSPALSLTPLLAEAGGLTVGEAMARVDANLASMKDECANELRGVLARCEAAFAGRGERLDDPARAAIYATALGVAGCGAVCGVPEIDPVLVSLFDLLQSAPGGSAPPDGAVRVHLDAWRLLLDGSLSPAERQTILAGLRQVTAKHATPRPQPHPA